LQEDFFNAGAHFFQQGKQIQKKKKFPIFLDHPSRHFL